LFEAQATGDTHRFMGGFMPNWVNADDNLLTGRGAFALFNVIQL